MYEVQEIQAYKQKWLEAERDLAINWAEPPIEDRLHPIELARITPNRELRLWPMTWRHRLDAAIRVLLGKPIKLR